MENRYHGHYPDQYQDILRETRELGFDMASDPRMGSLLMTLAASKPSGHFLELGTGTGLATSWLLRGMDPASTLITVDKDPRLSVVADKYFAVDERVQVLSAEVETLLDTWDSGTFDLIFADAWPGKYSLLNETLDKLRLGGIYIVDDMAPRESWPHDHHALAAALIEELGNMTNIMLTKIGWSTGVMLCVRVA